MEENGSIPSPQAEAPGSINGYLDAISDEELPSLVRNEERFRRICEQLIQMCQPLERREAAFDQLLAVVRRMSLRCDDLQLLVDAWLPKRLQLIEIMEEETKVLDITTKACNTSRLASAVIDTIGLAGNLVVGDSPYSNLALTAGKICRIVGFSSSALELFKKKSVLERLMRLLHQDRSAFEPIEAFFLQDSELEDAVKQLIPFEITSRLIRDLLTKGMYDDLSQTELLLVILRPLLLEDANRLRDIDLIRNVIAFTACPAAKDWCRWLILRHHKVSLDIDTMLLQMVDPQRLVGNHSVGLTAVLDRPSTISIVSRIGLNLVSIYDATNSLMNGGLVEDLRHLQNHLDLEMKTVSKISTLLQLRR